MAYREKPKKSDLYLMLDAAIKENERLKNDDRRQTYAIRHTEIIDGVPI